MKIFESNLGKWDNKVNFVDDNNVFVGFDMDQSCCETADWFIADTQIVEAHEGKHEIPDLTGWNFDPKFFKRIDGEPFDEGGMVIFRITNGINEKFLHLFNHHNGYYSHGFLFSKEYFEAMGVEKLDEEPDICENVIQQGDL